MAKTINPLLILLFLLLGATTLGVFVSRETTRPVKQAKTQPMVVPPLCLDLDHLADNISMQIHSEKKAKVVELAAKTEAQLRQERIENQLVQMQAKLDEMKAQSEADRAALREQSLELQAAIERKRFEQQALATGQARLWLDSTGTYTCVAKLEELDRSNPNPQTVVLRTVNSRKVIVSVERLCAADREHIRALYQPKVKEVETDSCEVLAGELDLPHKKPKFAFRPRLRIPEQAERPAILWEKIDWPESFRTNPYMDYTARIDDLVSSKAETHSIYTAIDRLKGVIRDHVQDHSPQEYVWMKQFMDDLRRGDYPAPEQMAGS